MSSLKSIVLIVIVSNVFLNRKASYQQCKINVGTFRANYSRMDQVKFVEDSLLLGPFLNTLPHFIIHDKVFENFLKTNYIGKCFYITLCNFSDGK